MRRRANQARKYGPVQFSEYTILSRHIRRERACPGMSPRYSSNPQIPGQTQVRQRDGPRRQVLSLQANGVRRFGCEHRPQTEQAEVLTTRARAAVVRRDPAKLQLQLQFPALLSAAAPEDDRTVLSCRPSRSTWRAAAPCTNQVQAGKDSGYTGCGSPYPTVPTGVTGVLHLCCSRSDGRPLPPLEAIGQSLVSWHRNAIVASGKLNHQPD